MCSNPKNIVQMQCSSPHACIPHRLTPYLSHAPTDWVVPVLSTTCSNAAEFTEIPEISKITETIALGSISHRLEMEVPERFCSVDISSEGEPAPALHGTAGHLLKTVCA